MTRVSGNWLESPATQAVLSMLTNALCQGLVVGGCVRNALIGAPVADVDIATDARPAKVIELAEAAGLRAVPTGFEHGTVTVIAGGVGHEVTTFRRDIATDGRRAVVTFAGRVEEDARRRDFTMNALYALADGTVIDPLGGLSDIEAHRVRFIDDAYERIREDYLRILRFFRFHAWYGDPAEGLDPEGLAACTELGRGVVQLSRERVGAEMRRLLAAPDPSQSIAAMARAGVLALVLPGADPRALPALAHLEADMRLPPDWHRRFAALGAAGEDMRFSRDETRLLARLRGGIGSGEPIAVLGYRFGARAAMDVALLRAALQTQPPTTGGAPGAPANTRAKAPKEALSHARAEAARGASARFPVRARDLMPAYEGAALGRKLNTLEAAWIASDFRLTRAELLA